MMQDAVAAKHGLTYLYGGNEVLYPASGVCPDYSTSRGAWGYTYELRPSSGNGGFAPPADQILPTAEECFEGILAAISWSKNPTGPTTPQPTPAPPPGTLGDGRAPRKQMVDKSRWGWSRAGFVGGGSGCDEAGKHSRKLSAAWCSKSSQTIYFSLLAPRGSCFRAKIGIYGCAST